MPDGLEELGLLPLAHKHGPLEEMHRAPVELGDCNVLIVSCSLTPNETAGGLVLNDWPAGVRVRVWGQVEGYFKAHPDRVARLVSSGVSEGVCFVMVHHAPKKSGGMDAAC
jgi:hypothetical protein